MTEGQLQRAVIELAELMGWRVYHVTNVKGLLRAHTSPGFPDLVLAKAPRVLFREMKNATKKPTPSQVEWLTLLDACGKDVAIWRPKHWLDGSIEATLR